MGLHEVYREYQCTRYYSTIFSRATLLRVTAILIIIIAPFFIAYGTEDFWLRTSTYIEQPKVRFLNQWISQIVTADSPTPKLWSTYYGLNRFLLQDTEMVIPVVKFNEDDYSFDQVNDKLMLTVNYTGSHLNVTAVNLLLFFELQFDLMATVIIQSAVHITSSWSIPSSSLWVSGDLVLYQRNPLPSSGRVTVYNQSFFNQTSISVQDYEMANIIREVQSRNVSTVLANSYSLWQSGTSSDGFIIQLELNYPKQTVTYSPGFWQTVKFAWIQYLAVMVILWYILWWVQDFVFENQVVLTVRKQEKRS